ncbi:hypothetical protein L1049_017784 [Liquidambar formosana]|uniref:UPF0113 domain-containing protein n=1 Tax=Liquidambar formosana TaxID=63359 RepID=A0AAP0N5B1_LIQFO
MRPLDEKETTAVFEKLSKFTVADPLGSNSKNKNILPGDAVVVFSMSDLPLGFGVAAKSTQDCSKTEPNGSVVLHQVDVGEYLRMEDEL